jgi:hypothetical protein
MVKRLVEWLKKPVAPPKWLAPEADPMDDVDWATFGRTVGGRITALDHDEADSRAKRIWKQAGKRTPLALPRWDWILIGVIIAVQIAGIAFLVYFFIQRMN